MDTLLSELPKTRSEAKEIGSMYYFTNKPCKNGHTSKRLVSNKHCYECDLGHSKNYHESNKEAIKDYKKSYRESNREAIREQQKAYRESNRESIREHMKSYYESNREAIRERNKSYYAAKVGKSPEEIGTRRTPDPARYVYFLVVKDSATNEKLFLKVGITNNPTYRLKTHGRRLSRHGLIFDTILVKDFETEEAARAVEAKIKSSYIVYESGIKGFVDECFMYLPQYEASMLALLSK